MSWSPLNYRLPGNKTAYAFSDAAGTNACIAMYRLNAAFHEEQLLFSNRLNFSSELSLVVQNNIPDFSTSGIDCLFTGTSHPESSECFEINCIKQAKSKGVYTISFIDHWVNFKLRFNGLNEDEMPDEIWVIDENAKDLAEKEGLPSAKIKIKGNPYHYHLRTCWKPAYLSKSYLSFLGIKEDAFHILFAPDPFSIRNIYQKTGFTEGEALKDLLTIVSEIKDTFLLIKLHPLQPEDVLLNVLEQYPNIPHKLIKEADVPELLAASDLVIGFYSNLLLEASALQKSTIRYFPGNTEADLLAGSQLLHAACVTPTQLKHKIHIYLND